MRRIAIYGKGGIGKSTVSSNVTAALSVKGHRVLQIGCDPKHDSTRLLTGGVAQATVLDSIRDGDPELGDLVVEGFGGALCVEAGGPEPGVGCAGRGIITTFERLRLLGVSSLDAEVILYDVLGDVVCGGFAVPLRSEYADTVFIVTSGEYMSIYAANNILRGVRRFGADRVGGLILNRRGLDDEASIVDRFADAVGLPVITTIPRSPVFQAAEAKGMTVTEMDPGSDVASLFSRLADDMLSVRRLPASPLDDGELERLVLGREPTERRPLRTLRPTDVHGVRPPAMSRNVAQREPLMGCAFSGAASTLSSVKGMAVIVHGPSSCGHLSYQTVAGSIRRKLSTHGPMGLVRPDCRCTDIGDMEMVFGGARRLDEGMRQAIHDGAGGIAVVTTCPSGIMGDDVNGSISRISEDHPDIPVIAVHADGNINGDFMQGVIDAHIAMEPLIGDREEDGSTVNLVAEKAIASNTETNHAEIVRLLRGIGADVGCRFVCNTSIESVVSMRRGICSLANSDRFAQVMRGRLGDMGMRFTERHLPSGMSQTREWLLEVGDMLDRARDAEAVADREAERYARSIERLPSGLKGKSIDVISLMKDVDWIIDSARDIGMEVRSVTVIDRPDHLKDRAMRSRYEDLITVIVSEELPSLLADLRDDAPDLLLSNYLHADIGCHQDLVPLCPDVGVGAGTGLARRWRAILSSPLREGWRCDLV